MFLTAANDFFSNGVLIRCRFQFCAPVFHPSTPRHTAAPKPSDPPSVIHFPRFALNPLQPKPPLRGCEQNLPCQRCVRTPDLLPGNNHRRWLAMISRRIPPSSFELPVRPLSLLALCIVFRKTRSIHTRYQTRLDPGPRFVSSCLS